MKKTAKLISLAVAIFAGFAVPPRLKGLKSALMLSAAMYGEAEISVIHRQFSQPFPIPSRNRYCCRWMGILCH